MKSLSPIHCVGLASVVVALSGCATLDHELADSEKAVGILPLEDRRAGVSPGQVDSSEEHPEPTFPNAARENSPKGAQATVEYFWKSIDHVRQTGHAQPAASVSHYVCDMCTEVIFRWQQLYDAGAWAILDGETQVEIVETQSYVEEDTQEEWTAVIFNVTEPASEFYLDGEHIEEESLDETTLDGWWAELSYDETEERWQIEWIDQDDSLAS